MINLKNVIKVVSVNKDNVPILNNIDLEIVENDFIIVTGKSGSGKTTLLNIIGGFDSKSSGTLSFKGDVIKNEKDRHMIRKQVGYVTQNYALINNETVKNNILLSLGVSKELKKYADDLDGILEKLKIIKLKNVKVNKLSGGEKQRVAIARALIKRPDVLLFDEPTGNLDKENSKMIIDIIKDIHSLNTTIILVTHDMDYFNLGNRRIDLVDGEITD